MFGQDFGVGVLPLDGTDLTAMSGLYAWYLAGIRTTLYAAMKACICLLILLSDELVSDTMLPR